MNLNISKKLVKIEFIKNIAVVILTYIYVSLIKPRLEDIDKRRKELILNLLLLSFIFFSFMGVILVILNQIKLKEEYGGVGLSSIVAVFFLTIILIIFSRKGYITLPSYILIFFYFLFSTYAGYKWGVDLPSTLLSYSLLIILSSILISTRFGFLISSAVGITIITLSYLETAKIYVPVRSWQFTEFTIDDAIEYVVIIFIIMLVSWISNRETEKSLKRAQRSEQELQKERDSLEIKIKERTNELRQVQLEKMINIYRFVEFGRLSSGLFHDLMSPLTSISIALEKFKGSNLYDLELVKQTNAALKSSRRMNGLLVHAKNNIHIPNDQSEFSLIDELKLVIDFLSSKWKKALVNIIIKESKDIKIYGNSVIFNHIATNLLSNAIDAYDKNTFNFQKDIFISISKKQKVVTFSITDFGCGIPLEIISHIFEPFYTTKDHTNGIGIGLSATKHAVEKYFNGGISVTSTKDGGTIFTVSLPSNND